MRTLTWWVAVVLAATAPVLMASPAQADTFQADIEDFAFTPDRIVIDVGDRVRWSNDGDETHTVTADDGSFDGDDIEPDDSYSKRFSDPGGFPYRCARYPEMRGIVEVRDDAGAVPAPPSAAGSTTPSTNPTSPTAAGAPAASAPPTTVPVPALRSSTTSTSTPPAVSAPVTVTTGEAPLFVPAPDELSGREAKETEGAFGGAGRDGADGGRDLWWGALVVGISAAGLGGYVLARRRKIEGRSPDEQRG